MIEDFNSYLCCKKRKKERENNNKNNINNNINKQRQEQEKEEENKNSLSDKGRQRLKRFDLIVRRFCHRRTALIHHPWLIHERHTALY